MTRRLALVAALTATVLLGSGCRDSSKTSTPRRPPRQGSKVATTVDNPAYTAIADSLRDPGKLTICDQRSGSGDASGSYEQRLFTVATGACPPEAGSSPGSVVVNAYDSPRIRDDSASTDVGDRLVAWTHLQLVISVSDGSPPEVVSGVERAMAALGAEKTYDERFPARSSG